MKNGFLALLLLAFAATSWAQNGSAFGVKGGPTMGFQKWNDFQQQPLFRYHGIVFIESLGDNVLFAQAGYHVKGSALRYLRFTNPVSGNVGTAPAQDFQFRNASLTIGAKKKHQIGRGETRAYYMLGLRGDYTINTNLKDYDDPNFPFLTTFPTDQWVRRLNYGMTLGGGFEMPFGELVGGILEFTFNPDLSRQYNQPAIENVYDPYTGTNRNVSERRIINITFEVTLGLRFLQIVEYID
ncbi:MAG: hypothetical protein IPH04_06565 [Saprospirales bacterium]|nr:hypothetical protein [Saprospirales bacterium]MBK6902465.1 hypothetical protein [Saprospirales bacterium]MBK7335757.1 hypothetical protein [Saprospirales bacterium]